MEQTQIKFKTFKVRKRRKKKEAETNIVDYGDNIVTYTWCECGENHHGNQQIGEIADPGQGFMRADLIAAKTFAEENYNCDTEMFNLIKEKYDFCPYNGEPLIVQRHKINEIVVVNSAHFLAYSRLYSCDFRINMD